LKKTKSWVRGRSGDLYQKVFPAGKLNPNAEAITQIVER